MGRFKEGEARKKNTQAPKKVEFWKNWRLDASHRLRNLTLPFLKVSSMIILGLVADQAFCFTDQKEEIVRAPYGRIAVLRRLARGSWELGSRLLAGAYKALFLSKISYAIPKYGAYLAPESWRNIDIRIIHVASRLVAGVEMSTRNEAHMLVSGMIPPRSLFVRRSALLMGRVIRNQGVASCDWILEAVPGIRDYEASQEAPEYDLGMKLTNPWKIPRNWEGTPENPAP